MFQITIKINKIKTFINDLDKDYGSGKYNKKDAIIGSIVISLLFVYSLFMTFVSIKKLFIFILSLYLLIISFSVLLLILFGYLYFSPKNNTSNKKKKKILKLWVIVASFLFLIAFSPVKLVIFIVDIISLFFGIQIFTRNIHIILLDLSIYIITYLLCVNNYKICKLNLIAYIGLIIFLYLITYILRKIIYRINHFASYREKYEYLYKSRSILLHIVNFLMMLSSVAGLYISKYNNGELTAIIIYYIMPIIIFAGIEQIFLGVKQNNTKKIVFIQNLYEELTTLYDISYKQIIDFSCIKIRIKILITPYIIENHKNYFFSKNGRNNKIIIEALDKCAYMLKKEYAVYLEDERSEFEKDLLENIDRLAKCLTIMK